MKKILFRVTLFILIVVAVLFIGAYGYLHHPKFGKLPEGQSLEVIKKSPNYKNGEFTNLVPTPMLTEDRSRASIFWENLFIKDIRLIPTSDIPTVKTNLKELDKGIDQVIWLGHSSFFVQIAGKRILIDPVFSTYGSPVSFANKAFAGTNLYSPEDMPEIDYLLITHDHWDHLDYPTIIALEPKVKKVISGLGVGNYFTHWGYPKEKIYEGDWNTSFGSDLKIHILPARHYSGRWLTRNKTLWVSYALESKERKLYFSGDSGYSTHFAQIGKQFGRFDLVMLDSGQYDKRWANIHMNPKEAMQAASDLGAKALLPSHLGRFKLAKHEWDEPLKIMTSQKKDYRVLTPMIGEPIINNNQQFSRWWEKVQ